MLNKLKEDSIMQSSEREMLEIVTELAVAYNKVATRIPARNEYKEVARKNNLGITQLMYIILHTLSGVAREKRSLEREVNTLLYRIEQLELELKQSRKGRIQKGEKRAYKDAVKKAIIELRKKGKSYREIADNLGISVGTVANRIKEHEKRLEEYRELGLEE